MPSGYIPEPLRFKDFSHEKAYGAAPIEPIVSLKRDVSGVPVIYQGDQPSCVSCTASFIKSWMETAKPNLSWEWLAKMSGTNANGVAPSKVFETARKEGIAEDVSGTNCGNHKIGAYFYVKPTAQAIYHALKTSLVAVGLTDWAGVGPHMVAAYDVTDDGTALKCKNWWNGEVQEDIIVPFSLVDDAVAFGEKPEGDNLTFSFVEVLMDKFGMLPAIQKAVGSAIMGILALIGVTTYGAAGVPGEYSTQLAQAITSSAITVPVVSRTLFTGETFTDADLFHPIAISIGKGSTHEYASCGFFATTGTFPNFQNCTRGMSALATSTSMTVVSGANFAHTAGETVAITNQPAFYQNLVDTHTAQTVAGNKTFTGNDGFTAATTTFGSGSAGLVYFPGSAKLGYSNDGVSNFTFDAGSSGVTASTTKGIFITASQVGINASSTGGLAFDSAGLAYVSVSSTTSTNGGFLNYVFGGANKLYWDVQSFLAGAWTWTGAQTFSGTVALNGTTTLAGSSIASNIFVNNQVAFGQATGTAQVAITAGQALWLSATSSQIMLTNTQAVSSTVQFIGLAVNSVAAGATVTYTKPGGINCNQSGLTTGLSYYMYGTAGQISAAPVQYFIGNMSIAPPRVGIATTATCLQVVEPKYVASGHFDVSGTGDTTIYTGFFPAHIILRAGCGTTGANTGYGFSVGDETNTSDSFGFNGTNYVGGHDTGKAVHVYCNAANNVGTVSSLQQTFTYNSGIYTIANTISYAAYSE